jgi:ribosomal protein S18 acetylase RimI-like enzyme
VVSDLLAIRPYRPEDRDAVIALWRHCDLLRAWNDPQRDIARKLCVQSELFLVGTLDDTIVATVMAGYEGHRGWISYLAVDPAMRGRGFGRAIMAAAENALQALGCPKVNLQIRTANAAVVRFYERIGYTVEPIISMGKRLIPDV